MNILFQDKHLIFLSKKCGQLVVSDRTGDTSMYQELAKVLPYVGTIHRLDRQTSGVIVFAKDKRTLAKVNQQFRERKVRKTYWAIVDKGFESKELSNYLTRRRKENKSFSHDSFVPGSHLAKLNAEVIKQQGSYSLLEIDLLTGRHHQIRA